ncbi:hypothetical protein [Natrinema halophilum]|uniref:SCP2 domain-containing protein n=1 Tax=Natrinema halophilum TaxID=1699371 RepID=A0A7D5GRS7_9EURY|nr:hypothetical protein [Natrinema halophilum]QLG48729.1 hypothetical protein HYG82_07655 [Natrinema halophilum]
MATNDIVQEIDASLRKSDTELEAALPKLLQDIEGHVETFVRDYPETFNRLIERSRTVDIASLVSDDPVIAATFQELLWTRTNVLAESSPEVKEHIDDDITVNFEAKDCPIAGHLVIDGDEQTMYGDTGRLDDPMLEITGPATTLIGLILGNVHPIRGYIQQQYDMDGPVHMGTRLAPIMNSLSEQVPVER